VRRVRRTLQVNGALRIAAPLVADTDARLQVFDPLVGKLDERYAAVVAGRSSARRRRCAGRGAMPSPGTAKSKPARSPASA
jgi:hypothetical protein